MTRRFSIKDYHRMGEVGILDEDDRVELLDGEIVEMTPIGPPHSSTVARLNHLCSERVQERAIVWVQNPIDLPAKDSEPQPDVVLLRPRADFYSTRHPTPDDVLLVEVMDSSAERDRQLKLPLYARAGIREVWLVDLATQRIEAYRGPTDAGFNETRLLPRGESTSIEALPDLVLRVDDILG